MSDQVFDDPGEGSIDADRDAAVNDTEDDDAFPPADRAGSVLADPTSRTKNRRPRTTRMSRRDSTRRIRGCRLPGPTDCDHKGRRCTVAPAAEILDERSPCARVLARRSASGDPVDRLASPVSSRTFSAARQPGPSGEPGGPSWSSRRPTRARVVGVPGQRSCPNRVSVGSRLSVPPNRTPIRCDLGVQRCRLILPGRRSRGSRTGPA